MVEQDAHLIRLSYIDGFAIQTHLLAGAHTITETRHRAIQGNPTLLNPAFHLTPRTPAQIRKHFLQFLSLVLRF